MSDADFYRSRIAMLKEDMTIFGPAGDDLHRLRDYERKLAVVESDTGTDSKSEKTVGEARGLVRLGDRRQPAGDGARRQSRCAVGDV